MDDVCRTAVHLKGSLSQFCANVFTSQGMLSAFESSRRRFGFVKSPLLAILEVNNRFSRQRVLILQISAFVSVEA